MFSGCFFPSLPFANLASTSIQEPEVRPPKVDSEFLPKGLDDRHSVITRLCDRVRGGFVCSDFDARQVACVDARQVV